jgi:hypothetical protein
MKCGRKFHPDLRFCPYCGGEARAPKTRLWNYEDKTVISHEEPVDDYQRKAYRQNGFLLLVAIILMLPALMVGAEEFLVPPGGALEASIVALMCYAVCVFVVIVYGDYCAFASKRPGVQALAAFLIWFNIGMLSNLAFVFFGLVFCLVWVAGASKSGKWTAPDASFLGLMTVVGIAAILWGYLWLVNEYYSFVDL